MGNEGEAFSVGNGIQQSVHPSFWEREDQRDPEGVSEGNKVFMSRNEKGKLKGRCYTNEWLQELICQLAVSTTALYI